MSAAFLSSASSTIRRASSSGGRSAAGAALARLGRPSARGAVAGSVGGPGHGGFGHDRRVPPVVPVEPMVADVRRDRIRDEVAQRSAGRRARRAARSPTGADAARRGRSRDRRGRADGRRGSPGRRPDSRRAARRRPVPARGPAAARARSSARGTPRPTGSASRSGDGPPRAGRRAGPRACRPCTTGPADRSRGDRPRTASLPAIASSTIARRCSAGVEIERPGLCGGSPAGMNRTARARAPRRPPRRPRGARRGSGRTSRRRRRASRARSARGPSVTSAPRAAPPIRARSPPIRTVSPAAIPARRSSVSMPSRARSRWKRSADSSTSKLVWAAIRSIRAAAHAEDAVGVELDAEAVAHRLDAVDDDARRARAARRARRRRAGGSAIRVRNVGQALARRRPRSRPRRCLLGFAGAPERRPGLGRGRQVDLVEGDQHRLVEERRDRARGAPRGSRRSPTRGRATSRRRRGRGSASARRGAGRRGRDRRRCWRPR